MKLAWDVGADTPWLVRGLGGAVSCPEPSMGTVDGLQIASGNDHQESCHHTW